MHKKRPNIFTCCRVSKGEFYLYHGTKIATAWPGLMKVLKNYENMISKLKFLETPFNKD